MTGDELNWHIVYYYVKSLSDYYVMKMAYACYFHQALVKKMFAVIIFDLCICSFVWECEWFLNMNAKQMGLM